MNVEDQVDGVREASKTIASECDITFNCTVFWYKYTMKSQESHMNRE